MSTLGCTRLRLAADTASFDAPLDVLRRATPQFWRGNDVQFEIAVFFNGALQDVSSLASLTLEIRPLGANGGPPDPSFTPLMGATIASFDNTTTLDDWNAGTKQQAVVAFSAAQSNIAAGAAWLSVFAITNDTPGRVITLCAGAIRVLEDGAGLATTPTPAADTFYTAAESDARFAAIGAGGEGGAPASDDNPLMDGTAAAGSSTSYSRADHVHPTDTSRAGATHASQHGSAGSDPVMLAQSQVTGLTSALAALAPLASPALTGTPTAPTVATATDSSTKLATTAFVQAAITAAGGGGGAGSVTSVAMTVPAFLSVSGSPVTSSGTLAVSLATQSANTVLAGPTTGSAAAPTFRSLVAADIPNIAESQVTNLTTDLAAKAPLASPALTGTPTAPTVSGTSDSTTKIATTAFVQAVLATIPALPSIDGTTAGKLLSNDGSAISWASPGFTVDGSGDIIFNGSTALVVQDGSGTNNAEMSVYGAFAAKSSSGLHKFIVDSSDDLDVILVQRSGTSGGHATGQSSIDFMSSADYDTTAWQNSIMGAVGFSNLYGDDFVGGMYISTSPPFTQASGFAQPTTGVGEFHLIQEGWFLATQYRRAHRLYLKNDWTVIFGDPVNATMAQFLAPPNGNNVEFQVLGSKGYSANPFSTGGDVNATISAISTTGNVIFLASYTSSESYHAYPASGGTLGSTGAGGLSLVALDSAGIIKFLTGGDNTSNERLRIDANGNFIASNVVTSAPSATLANSQYQFTVYDNSGTAVFEIRYKDASGTVKTGTVALS